MLEKLTRSNYKENKKEYNQDERSNAQPLFENLEWLTTKETAFYLRRTVNAIHILVSRGKIRTRKFQRRLYFKKSELEYLIETSSSLGGF